MDGTIDIEIREHGEIDLPSDFPIKDFKKYLDEVWANRLLFAEEDFGEEPFESEPSRNQPFFHFPYEKIKARNYIGFIHWRNHRFEVYPKVFAKSSDERINFWEHLFYWLSYCRRIVFPFAHLDTMPKNINELPEALIYAFSKHTGSLLKEMPYSKYEEVTTVSQAVKGRLNVTTYINEQYAKGNPQQLVINHEPFVYDNILNQVIKAVATNLQNICRFPDTFQELQSIRFQLEEVSDIYITAKDCDSIKLNPLYSEYGLVIDMCRFFLTESYLNREMGNTHNLSFLLPMEYIFEDYVAGFLEKHFGTIFKVNYQSRNWFTDQNVFRIKHDILLIHRITEEKIIIDTKYKLRQCKQDAKKGISQVDLYQMVSYALRAGSRKVLLIYPRHPDSSDDINHFTISSPLMNGEPISVYAADIDFVHTSLKSADNDLQFQLERILNHILSSN